MRTAKEKPVTCSNCGTVFDISKGGLTGRGLKFCSMKCCDEYVDREKKPSQTDTPAKDEAPDVTD